MYISWAFAGIPLGAYNLAQNLNIALQVQPNILIFLSLVAWAQCKYYGDGWHLPRILASSVLYGAVIGGAETGLYFALRLGRRRGVEWPMILVAVLAAVLLAIGVLRYYWEIYKARSVQGISYMFVLVDAGGDLVSILAIVFSPRIDEVGMAVYAVELVLWIGIGLLGVHYRFRPWMAKLLKKPQDGGQEREGGEVEQYG